MQYILELCSVQPAWQYILTLWPAPSLTPPCSALEEPLLPPRGQITAPISLRKISSSANVYLNTSLALRNCTLNFSLYSSHWKSCAQLWAPQYLNSDRKNVEMVPMKGDKFRISANAFIVVIHFMYLIHENKLKRYSFFSCVLQCRNYVIFRSCFMFSRLSQAFFHEDFPTYGKVGNIVQ